MHTLYFVKLRHSIRGMDDQIVLLYTAESETAARERAPTLVVDQYRDEYTVVEVTAVCHTPDVVEYFEPC